MTVATESGLRRLRASLIPQLETKRRETQWKAGVLFLAVSVPIVASWYRGATYVGGSDDSFPLALRDVERYSQLVGAPLVAPDPRKLPFLLPWGLVLHAWRLIGIPWSGHFAQLSLNVALMALAGLGGFKLTQWALPRVHIAGAVVGGLIYELNLFGATIIWNEQSLLVFHYALMPWAWLAWDKALKSPTPTTIARATAIWVICLCPSYVTTPSVVTDVSLFVGLALWRIATRKSQRWKCVVAALTVVAAVSLCSLFWIVPLVHYFGSEYTFGTAAGPLQGLLTLNSVPLNGAIRFGGFWGLTSGYDGSPYFPWASTYLSWAYGIGYAIPVLAFVGLLTAGRGPRRIRKAGRDGSVGGTERQATEDGLNDKAEAAVGLGGLPPGKQAPRVPAGVPGAVLILAIVAEASIFMATGTDFPLGPLKLWLLTRSHLAAEFRSIYQRFETYVPLGIAPLAGIGTSSLLRHSERGTETQVVERSDQRRRLRVARQRPELGRRAWTVVVFAVVLTTTVIIPAYPMIVGSIFDQSGVFPAARVVVPKPYIQLGDWLSRVDGNRELVLPLPISQAGLSVLSWANGSQGFYGTQPLELLTDLPVMDSATAGSAIPHVLAEMARGAPSACGDLRALDVGFIVLETDVDSRFIAGEQGWIGTPARSVERTLDSAPAAACLAPALRFGPVLTWRVTGHFVSPLSWQRSCESSPSSVGGPAMGGQTADAEAVGTDGWKLLEPPPIWARCVVLAIPFDSAWSLQGGPPKDVGGLTGFTLAGVRLGPGHALVLTNEMAATTRWLLWLGLLGLLLALLAAYAPSLLSRGWSATRKKRGD